MILLLLTPSSRIAPPDAWFGSRQMLNPSPLEKVSAVSVIRQCLTSIF